MALASLLCLSVTGTGNDSWIFMQISADFFVWRDYSC